MRALALDVFVLGIVPSGVWCRTAHPVAKRGEQQIAGLANRYTRKPAYPKVSPPLPLIEDVMVQRTKKSRLVAVIRRCIPSRQTRAPFSRGLFRIGQRLAERQGFFVLPILPVFSKCCHANTRSCGCFTVQGDNWIDFIDALCLQSDTY